YVFACETSKPAKVGMDQTPLVGVKRRSLPNSALKSSDVARRDTSMWTAPSTGAEAPRKWLPMR
ncbi:MAG: hypothetical protein WBX25_34125, partial [Rhodomicrobium sp.]